MKKALNNHQKKAFTLIELLIVIAIIGILSGISLSAIQGAREKAKKARAQAEMKQFVDAVIFAQGQTGKTL